MAARTSRRRSCAGTAAGGHARPLLTAVEVSDANRIPAWRRRRVRPRHLVGETNLLWASSPMRMREKRARRGHLLSRWPDQRGRSRGSSRCRGGRAAAPPQQRGPRHAAPRGLRGTPPRGGSEARAVYCTSHSPLAGHPPRPLIWLAGGFSVAPAADHRAAPPPARASAGLTAVLWSPPPPPRPTLPPPVRACSAISRARGGGAPGGTCLRGSGTRRGGTCCASGRRRAVPPFRFFISPDFSRTCRAAGVFPCAGCGGARAGARGSSPHHAPVAASAGGVAVHGGGRRARSRGSVWFPILVGCGAWRAGHSGCRGGGGGLAAEVWWSRQTPAVVGDGPGATGGTEARPSGSRGAR